MEEKEAFIEKEWLTVQNYEFKLLVMIAVLAENHLAYRGKLKDMCEFLGVNSSGYNNKKVQEAINKLAAKGDILVIKEGQTWTLTLSVKAEKKPKVVRIKNAWVTLIQKYKATEGNEVAWENILKVLVYLIADKKEVKKLEEIAAEVGISVTTVKRCIVALDGIEFGDLAIKRKLAWFKTKQDEFKVAGQKIDVVLTFGE